MEHIKDLNIDDLTIFSLDGIVDIKKVKMDVANSDIKLPTVVIYGRCAAGNDCEGIHGVAFEPRLFIELLKTYQDKYYPKLRLDTQ